MNLKHIRNIFDTCPPFVSNFTESLYENYNSKLGIANRMNAYIKFVKSIQNNSTPLKKVLNDDIHPWEHNDEYCKTKKLSKKLYKKYIKSNTVNDKKAYINAKINCINIYNRNKKIYYHENISKSIGSPLEFYKLVNKNFKSKNQIPDKMISNTNECLIVTLARSLSKKFTTPLINLSTNQETLINQLTNIYNTNINSSYNDLWINFSLTTSSSEIEKLIKFINNNKNPGPMGIHPRIIKEEGEDMLKSIENICHKSLKYNLPRQWKNSFLIPIPKPGNLENVANYRAIAIQSTIPKLIDKIITKKLYDAISTTLDDNQHGFIKKKGSLTNLLDYTEDILLSRKNKKIIDAIYFDWSKAFDTIDYSILAKKLAQLSYPYNLYLTIMNFVTNRSYELTINGIPTIITKFILKPVYPKGHTADL